MCTNLSNPDYLPAVCIEVSIINFTVTFSGLREQLLSSVVKQVSLLGHLHIVSVYRYYFLIDWI